MEIFCCPYASQAPPGAHKKSQTAVWLGDAGRKRPGSDYCSKDMTIEDMLLLCFSIAVPACSSICDEVMFELSVAKSTSMMRPVAACIAKPDCGLAFFMRARWRL